jgi:hypothetical protein
MSGAVLPIISYGEGSAPPPTDLVTWFLNGDGTEFGAPPAFVANIVGLDDDTPEIFLGFSLALTFGGLSPRSVNYPNGLLAPADSSPVLFIVLAGGPYDSDPTNITFGGLAFSLRNMSNNLVETHLTAGMLPLRGGLPGSSTLTVTWPEADGFSLRARLLTMLFVSDQSDDWGTGFAANVNTADAAGEFSMQIDSAPNDIVLTAVWSPVLAVTTAPTGFTDAGNTFVGDHPFNVAYRVTE